MDTYRIGEVAELTGVTVEALRYYEQRGLLKAPSRTPSGYRTYGTDAVGRVRFIRQAQALGLTLEQIHELLREHRTTATCRRVHDLLTRRLADVDAQIRALRELRKVLDTRRRACEQALDCGSETACPTLKELQHETH
jgi:DNA-binding transcriptional MerR regulator